MEYISSDTNVWIDFFVINRISLPFRLPYTYIMSKDAVNDELLSPDEFREILMKAGLRPVEYTIEEFEFAEQFGSQYPKLSIYDRIALAIAKVRKITLLTGDAALRKAAIKEGVTLMGTLGIIDQLFDMELINNEEYCYCLQELKKNNGCQVRLPKAEIESRLQKSSNSSPCG
jgi:predicted nucleic acid-binding protein